MTMQTEKWAEWVTTLRFSEFEQLFKLKTDRVRSPEFRACARNGIQFFYTFADAREWAKNLVRKDLPVVSVEECVDGVWELKEIHTVS